jgi:hypothetical protein
MDRTGNVVTPSAAMVGAMLARPTERIEPSVSMTHFSRREVPL